MKMISVKGYRAFNGRMLVQLAPKVKDVPPFVVGPCDWIYVPTDKKWYADAHAYSEDVCTPLFDEWKEN